MEGKDGKGESLGKASVNLINHWEGGWAHSKTVIQRYI